MFFTFLFMFFLYLDFNKSHQSDLNIHQHWYLISCTALHRPHALTWLVGVGEVRAEVEHQVQVASLLDASSDVPERLLGQHVEVLAVQVQLVVLVGIGDQPVDVLVVGGVVPHLRAVDVALDLIGRQQRGQRERERERDKPWCVAPVLWDRLVRLILP